MKKSEVRNFFMLPKKEQDKVRFEVGGNGNVKCPHCNGGVASWSKRCCACSGSGIVYVRGGKYIFERNSK